MTVISSSTRCPRKRTRSERAPSTRTRQWRYLIARMARSSARLPRPYSRSQIRMPLLVCSTMICGEQEDATSRSRTTLSRTTPMNGTQAMRNTLDTAARFGGREGCSGTGTSAAGGEGGAVAHGVHAANRLGGVGVGVREDAVGEPARFMRVLCPAVVLTCSIHSTPTPCRRVMWARVCTALLGQMSRHNIGFI